MNKRFVYAVLVLACLVAFAGPAFRSAAAQAIRLSAELSGFNEVAPVLTTGSGEFTAMIDPARTSLTFTLTYSDLLADALQSHIHFGQRGVNGGVMVFFCTNLTPPAGVPQPQPCPLRGGTVTGTITAADVVGPTGQGINPGNLDNVISAILSGHTYANVHSTRWPGGEIRGQAKAHSADN